MSVGRRLWTLVLALAVAGAAAQVALGAALSGLPAIAPLATPDGWTDAAFGRVVLAAVLLLGVAGELLDVRLRHGDEVEELTLTEAASVAAVLLLPPVEALLVPVVATAVSSVVRRRVLVKAVYNAGNAATGAALLLASVHALSGPLAGLSLGTTVGLVLGTTGFAAVNLLTLSRVLAVASGTPAPDAVRDGLWLSAVMALGSVGLGATFVVLAAQAPALLPFSVLPAVALNYAFRAAAHEVEERLRGARLLELSQLLAGRLDPDEAVPAFLRLTRQAFSAAVAVAVVDGADGADGPQVLVDDRERGSARRAATPPESLLLGTPSAAVLAAPLPAGWDRGLVAPLEAGGHRLGVVAVGWPDRSPAVGARELALLTPMTSALAAAMQGAAHLQQLTDEKSKLQAVVDQSSDGILVLDGDGRVLLWSPAVARLTGVRSDDAVGRPAGKLIDAVTASGSSYDALAAARAQLTPEEPHTTGELSLRRPDGEERVVRCAHAAVFDDDGALLRDVVIVHDVTRERQVERLKADFIATVSHELRTPVTPIKGYADLLRRRGAQMTPEKRAECLDVISDRAEHLTRLVEDLLLASRISATEGSSPTAVDLAACDLVPLVRRACGDFGADGERLRVDLPAEPVAVAVDPLRVVQVLTNLVGNALKYSEPGTPVDVRLQVSGDRVEVEVEDRGRGIPTDQLERVFDKFHRVEDPMRMTTGGTGLGLYIARELTTAMGGRLDCRSTLGVGSVFRLTLPAAVPAPRGPSAPVLAEGRSG